MSEYSKALAIMERMFAQSRISGIVHYKKYAYSKNRSGEIVRSKSEDKLVRNFDKIGESFSRISTNKGVICTNPDYSFMLKREAADKPFLVHQLGDPTKLKNVNDVYLLRFLRAGFCVDNVPVSKIIGDKSFAVSRISEVESGEQVLQN